jgi:hypothetical protein
VLFGVSSCRELWLRLRLRGIGICERCGGEVGGSRLMEIANFGSKLVALDVRLQSKVTRPINKEMFDINFVIIIILWFCY